MAPARPGMLRALVEEAASRGFKDGKNLLLSELDALSSLCKELESVTTYNAHSSMASPGAHSTYRDLKNIAILVSERFLSVLLLKLNSV